MAKMKMNERKDYTLGKNDVITYKKSRIPRQKQFMILRGPGLNVQAAIAENEDMKKLAAKNRFKIKFMQANSVDELIVHLKDANTWATGVIYNVGTLMDESKLIKKTIDRLLIPTLEVSDAGKVSSVIDGLATLLQD